MPVRRYCSRRQSFVDEDPFIDPPHEGSDPDFPPACLHGEQHNADLDSDPDFPPCRIASEPDTNAQDLNGGVVDQVACMACQVSTNIVEIKFSSTYQTC